MFAVASDATNVGVSTVEISDGSISSEGEPPKHKLYRKPRVKKRRFDAKNSLHPRKIYGVNNLKMNGVITTPPQPNGQPQNQIEENIDLSSEVVPRGPNEVSTWNAFSVSNKLFSQCCETLTWVWNRCGNNIIFPEKTTTNEVTVIQIQEEGETEY